VEFLDDIILGDGVHMDLRKVQSIVDWVALAFVQDVQCSLGLPISISNSLHIIP
jgi:hypothetical protein